MKNLSLFVIIIFSFTGVFSQESSSLSKKEEKQLAKEKKYAETAAKNAEQIKLTRSMLENRRFVLEADFVSGRTGERAHVNSTINFMAVDSSKAVIQLGSPWGIGINGVGGITVDGRVTRYDLTVREKKKGITYSLTLFVMSSLGTFDITIWVSELGRADATVRGNVSGQLTYSGYLVPPEESRVFKGSSIP